MISHVIISNLLINQKQNGFCHYILQENFNLHGTSLLLFCARPACARRSAWHTGLRCGVFKR